MILQKEGGQARQKNSGQVGKTISHFEILKKFGIYCILLYYDSYYLKHA